MHYNECYLITKNINISDIKLQKEEVSEVQYFPKDELLKRISNNYEGLTENFVCLVASSDEGLTEKTGP